MHVMENWMQSYSRCFGTLRNPRCSSVLLLNSRQTSLQDQNFQDNWSVSHPSDYKALTLENWKSAIAISAICEGKDKLAI